MAPVPATDVKDPTGCGDAYRAGLLLALAKGVPLLQGAQLGSVLGAIKIAVQGCQNHKPTLAEIRAELRGALRGLAVLASPAHVARHLADLPAGRDGPVAVARPQRAAGADARCAARPRKALYTICGGALGFVIVIALSMFGIGALLQTSLVWLTVLKWLGGAYLVWLGIQVWRAPPIGLELSACAAPRGGASMFRQGALSALTNPKALLFFAAFLPQFIDPARSLCCSSCHGRHLRAGRGGDRAADRRLRAAHQPVAQRVGRRFNQACGGVFMAIGVALPLRP